MRLSLLKGVLAASLMTLSACSSMPTEVFSGASSQQLVDPLRLYLRGEFSWWDAVEEYRLKQVSDKSVYSVNVNLLADGQPYKFKFADEHWSEYANCGISEENNIVQLGSVYRLDCNTLSSKSAFVFKPEKNGTYTFSLSLSEGYPQLLIESL
jgi:hypothetical protein